MKNRAPNMKYLFEPQSVAVIGASHNEKKIGYKILENIIDSKYPGKIYPVNPKGGEILGLQVYKSLKEINKEIHLVCIAIPVKYTFDAVKDCASCNIKFIILITSGFSEIGNINGERRIVEYANKNGMRILGPNIFGVYSSKAPINLTFGPKDIKPGNIAIITQSGAIGIAMLGKTKAENIGVSSVVSVGNKSDIDEADLLEYLVNDKNAKVILMYIEGIKNGEKLVRMLKNSTKKKPIIVIKSGRSERGAMAAASHTGSLAGADEIFSDIMKQCGVIRAESIQDAFNWCKFLANSPSPKGENTIIITNGGGIGVLATDACEKYGVHLYDDIQTTKEIFTDVVPEFGSTKNPIDLTGQATVADYECALKAALKSKDIHSIICLGCETAVFDAKNLFLIIDKMFSESRPSKPLVFSFFGGIEMENLVNHLKINGIPALSDVYEAVPCFGAMYVNYRNIKYQEDFDNKSEKVEMDNNIINNIIKNVRKDKRHFVLSYEAERIMKAAGIKMPESNLAHNIDEAVMYSEKIGYPVVMKVVSKDIIHKSDIGGVALDI
ncbi:CoA-binding protein, partial [candidate division WOR-3 bacterium]|nr:CoA-binding protein [candidate division WOR-3 bacterium]